MIHLHNHTSGSVLDGSCDIVALVKAAKEQGMTALAITDHGNMIKALEFQQECLKQDIKPIIGCEFYMGEPNTKNKYHIVCLAKDQQGIKNLYKLNTFGYLSNFYSKPRITWEKLVQHSAGLIVLSGCIGSEMGQKYLDRSPGAVETMIRFREAFGDDFYLEVQPNAIPFQKTYNLFLAQMSSLYHIPLVVTCDVHYVKKEDYTAHDVMLCMQVKKKVEDENRFRFSCNDFFLKSSLEIIDDLTTMGMSQRDIHDAIINTEAIARKCNGLIQTGLNLLPRFEGMSNDEEYSRLATLCSEGYSKRFKTVRQDVIDRVYYELEVIKSKGYSGYFLIVEDFIRYAKEKNILVGPGRGSVAGSMVAYLLGITNIDPIKYGLLFERFLNPDRDSPPDVDSDFDYERRDEVIHYVKEKYGQDKVASIIAEGSLASRAVVRKVMTAYDFEQRYINMVCKTLSDRQFDNLQGAYGTIPEFKTYMDTMPEKFSIMKTLEGLMSYVGKHAAGIAISDKPIDDNVPCMRDSDTGDMMTQWHKKLLEKVGVYKFDFLGLKTLTILRKTLESIKANHDVVIDLDSIDLADTGIYNVLNSGDLCGVFQFDAPSGKQTINKIKPQTFDDIIAAEALCRPGVRESDLYYENRDDIEYAHPAIQEILEPTRGAIVYQEQTMLLMNKLAGWSLGKGDSMRKVKNLEEYRLGFVEDCNTNGICSDVANDIFNRFSLEYSFNKSHAAAYATVSALCAWLKNYYRTEFMASVMTLEVLGDADKLIEQIRECGKHNINVELPDVRKSRFDFVPSIRSIKFPLSSIASVGGKVVEAIDSMFANSKNYTSFEEFLQMADSRALNKRTIVNLIKAGAFDYLCANRNTMICQYLESRGEDTSSIVTWSREVQRAYEKEMLGISISSSPLDSYIIPSFETYEDGDVTTMGIVKTIKTIMDKNSKAMAFITIESKTDTFESIFFSHIYNKYRLALAEGMIVKLRGRKDGTKLLVNELQTV